MAMVICRSDNRFFIGLGWGFFA